MECLRQKININISCNHLSTHVFFAKTHAVTVTFLAGTCSTTDNKLGDPEASLTLDIFARTPVVLASSVNSGGVGTTVDGSEIRRSPVEVGSSSHYLQGFIHPRWCRISSIHSRIFCCWVQSGTKHCEVIRGRFFLGGVNICKCVRNDVSGRMRSPSGRVVSANQNLEVENDWNYCWCLRNPAPLEVGSLSIPLFAGF